MLGKEATVYRELRRQRRKTQLAEHLAELQANALHKVNDFDAHSLYDEDGLPQ